MTATAARELARLEDSREPMISKRKHTTVQAAITEAEKRGMASFNYGRLWMVKNKKTNQWKGYGAEVAEQF